jgi:hypothetical protein
MLKKLLLLNIGLFFVPWVYAAELNSGDTSWILTSTAFSFIYDFTGLSFILWRLG